MGEVKGFMKYDRQTPAYRPVAERLEHWSEFEEHFEAEALRKQGARCMDCGVPFCHTGCPLGNLIPDWNDAITRNRLEEALELLHATNNFPEFTGRVCPAPCEAACVLGINRPPVSIKAIEHHIIDLAFERGIVHAQPPEQQTGKKVAVVGSGPSGLACAQQLCRAGHHVVVYERDDRIGGLLIYGIPDFKLDKDVVRRRVKLMEEEGVVFQTGCHVGVNVSVNELREKFDAICLCGGATWARELPIPGRELKGIHLAMEFLTQQNRRVAGEAIEEARAILATGRKVVILGGGDTGSDCLGTSHRHKAAQVSQYELLMRPKDMPQKNNEWPFWPNILRTSSSQEEGGQRDWGISTTEFLGDANGRVRALRATRVEFQPDPANGRMKMVEVPNSQFEQEVDLVLLALGFVGPERDGALKELGVELDPRGNVKAGEDYMTSIPGVFSSGDMRRGQSLVVWAIVEGREAACAIDKYLMGCSNLPNQANQFNTSGLLNMRR